MTRVATAAHSRTHAYLNGQVFDAHHQLILDGLLARFGIVAGDRIVEVGAGSGRYTEALLARGLEVTVIEPDLTVLELLRRRLGCRSSLNIRDVAVANCGDVFATAHLVCGFHVLHHLSKQELGALGAKLAKCSGAVHQDFKGWFFLEPNPANPLYPLQITFSRAMRWREERGIWTTDYAVLTRDQNTVPRLGDVGLFPPRPWVARLPQTLVRSGTLLSRRRSPIRCYTVYGEVPASG